MGGHRATDGLSSRVLPMLSAGIITFVMVAAARLLRGPPPGRFHQEVLRLPLGRVPREGAPLREAPPGVVVRPQLHLHQLQMPATPKSR